MSDSSVQIDCYAHIPGIRLEPERHVHLEGSILGPISVEEWLDLEDVSLVSHRKRFEIARPEFFSREYTVIGGSAEEMVESAMEQFLPVLERLSLALLFTIGRPIPSADRSVCYLRIASTGCYAYRFGLNDRELMLVQGDDLLELTPSKDQRLVRIFARLPLGANGAPAPEASRMADVIRMINEPGLTPVDMVVGFVAVLEDLLNPSGDRPLATTFARRAALAHAEAQNQVLTYRDFFAGLYAFRSRILHGDGIDQALNKIEQQLGSPLIPFLFTLAIQTVGHLGIMTSLHGSVRAGAEALLSRLEATNSDDAVQFSALRRDLPLDWLSAE